MPSVAALAAPAANRLPWSKYKINKTGPATTGSTIRIPATREPQRLPASEEATTSRGAEQQLRRQDSHWCSVSQELLLPSLSRSAVVGRPPGERRGAALSSGCSAVRPWPVVLQSG